MEKLKHFSLLNETWVFIKGTEEKYAVSNEGRVVSFWKQKPIIMKPRLCKNGYLALVLYLPTLEKTERVHRLVAMHFVDNPEQKPEVNHKNGIKTDNTATNLEWATRGENVRHSVKAGLHKGFGKGQIMPNRHRGERSPTAVLTEDQVRQIRIDIAAGTKWREVAEKYNIKLSTVNSALTCWKHVK